MATLGCAVSAVVCFIAAWKLCEADRLTWICFAALGLLALILSVGVALQPERDFDI